MSRSERVYGMLLLAYPREFRRDCGAEMVQAFRDLCRDQGVGSYVTGSGRHRVRGEESWHAG
jgi:hypothetical protein